MSSVTILIPARHRLDHEKDYNNIEEMGSSGHLGDSWRAWTWRMTSLSSHTAINKCRKKQSC